MNVIEKAIQTYGKDFNFCFVFPSGLASGLWFRKALEITGLNVLPSELYISWDIFKERNFNFASKKKLSPAEQAVRILYSEYLMNKNKTAAASGKPLLHSIVPTEFAKTSEVFSSWLSGILPQLDHWEKRFKKSGLKKDAEAEDLLFIKENYSEFLYANNLFEPSWIAANFDSNGKKYLIIFPELLEDFSEYEFLLKKNNDVFFLHLDEDLKNSFPVSEFPDTRLEIKYTVSEIEKLLLSGIQSDEIAVSVVNLEELKPYLKREFEERGIPAEFRHGENLSKNQAASLFKYIDNVIQTHYSFAALKTLFLNKHIPWKAKDIISSFINFGIENNCALSWQENGTWKNVWNEAFNSAPSLSEEEYKAKEMFALFSSMIEKIVNSKSFADMLKNYFEFRDTFINVDEFTENDENIIARCVSILNKLVILENKISEYMPPHKFKFFLKMLDTEVYVEQSSGLAVSVFPYKIAASAPFKYHFVMNVNQKDGSVVYNKLSFLRKDKKINLGVSDSDASLDFAAAYNQAFFTRFSYSKKMYNDYAMAHSLFTDFVIPETDCTDSFKQEKLLFENKTVSINGIYKKQHDGVLKQLIISKENNFSLLETPFENCPQVLKNELQQIQYSGGNVLVSATDLNKFFAACPVLWLMEKILKISFENFDAEIFNPRRTGNMYHFILENLYKKIKESDGFFIKEKKEEYMKWAVREIENTAGKNIELRGPLAKPFIESMSGQIMTAVEFVLSFDSEKLNGYIQSAIEDKFDFFEDGILYNGKMDRLVRDGCDLVILDYKKSKAPKFSDYNIENGAISDFQMPMYIFLAEKKILAENKKDVKVADAFFIKLIDKDFVPVIIGGNINCGAKRSGVSREDFEDRIEILKNAAKSFKEKINSYDFVPQSTGWNVCSDCRFKKICRTTFIVRGR